MPRFSSRIGSSRIGSSRIGSCFTRSKRKTSKRNSRKSRKSRKNRGVVFAAADPSQVNRSVVNPSEAKDDQSPPLLHQAISNNDYNYVIEILSRPDANNLVNQVDANGYSPVYMAVIYNNPIILARLLEKRPNLEIIPPLTGRTALAEAIAMGSAQMVNMLIQAGANPNILINEIPAIILISRFGGHYNHNMFKLFLVHPSVNLNVHYRGETVLRNLVESHMFKMACDLVRSGRLDGRDLTIWATANTRAKQRFALECLPVDWADANGNTPLHMAALSNNLELVFGLIRAGARPQAINANGQLPGHLSTDITIRTILLEPGRPAG
jgi:ankyrin repeat protein